MSRIGSLWQIGRTFGMRDGLLRLGYEAQRAGGTLSRRMRSVQGWESWEPSRIARNTSPEEFLSKRREGKHPFFFADSRRLAPELKKIVGASGEALVLAEANKILQGTLPYFGRLSFSCGFPPKWFENPVTKQYVSPDRPWTKMRFASADYGDLKFILEPSRFLFVYPLVRAYALSGDERYAEAFWLALESWHAANPPMTGPLWICGQESSLRIMAWSFAFYGFLHSPATTPKRAATLLSMIAAHAWRTMQTVSYARSQRSNHLISEAVGLWTAGTLYPELNDAAAWQEQGSHLLREAVIDQITPAGAYLQDSFNYQRMVLQQLFWTIRLAEIHNIKIDDEIKARTMAAFKFIREFVDRDSGQAPNHGSNDGSYILPVATCNYGDFRPLLRMGSSVLSLPTSLEAGPWDEAALWLCGGALKAARQTSSPEPLNLSSSLAEGSSDAGYYRLGSANSWAMVRAGHYTRRPFQADQLHVDLWWRGLNLARDAGTYLYNGERPWDNGLAGSAVHNTVTIDQREQMRRAGRFLWLDWAQASGKVFATGNENYPDSFKGEHDGYRRLGVTNRRMVRAVTEDAWVVVDDLIGSGNHELRLHWLLPDFPFEVVSEAPFRLALASDNTRFRWNIFSSAPGNAAIVRGGKVVAGNIENVEILGWESPTYGELRTAISVLYRVRAPLPVRMVTVIVADASIDLRQTKDKLIVSREASSIYQVELKPVQCSNDPV